MVVLYMSCACRGMETSAASGARRGCGLYIRCCRKVQQCFCPVSIRLPACGLSGFIAQGFRGQEVRNLARFSSTQEITAFLLIRGCYPCNLKPYDKSANGCLLCACTRSGLMFLLSSVTNKMIRTLDSLAWFLRPNAGHDGSETNIWTLTIRIGLGAMFYHRNIETIRTHH